ncbi:Rossmann-like and DUF2520 domain-containing protein [Paludibacterium yongneupense]|uniref:Rossmann-like and DUF2520 domain-containing protein n=1 Tax=Paludibacterium yongneupense TaxID=400061 RepID=UPI00055AF6FF|nr:Rossmann-like and DUF2520 domain-containing protein [Paludibacterium yongneupense]
MKTLNIVGAGRLGKVIARLARNSGRYRVAGICNRSPESAAAAVAFVGEGRACASLSALPAADMWLLAVPDAAIGRVAAELAMQARVAPGALAFHASGACEAALLGPLARRGLRCASLHPAFSFADAERAVATFAGTRCALEGEADACVELESLARDIGGLPFRLAPGGKPAYHAALCVASNYLLALTALAQELACAGGVEQALPLIGALMRQTLENALEIGPQAALTGPIARGDVQTVARHLAVMPSPMARATYLALGRATLEMAAPGLAPDDLERLAAELAPGADA